MGTVTVFEVLWEYADTKVRKITRVKVIDGYSTIHDIPKIIATSRWGQPGMADKVKIINRTFISKTPDSES